MQNYSSTTFNKLHAYIAIATQNNKNVLDFFCYMFIALSLKKVRRKIGLKHEDKK